jgi:outer membrane protein assembly factor BamB
MVDATWVPAADGMVRTIVPDGSRVYVGGDFAHIGGGNLDHVAAVDATDGTLVGAFAAAGTKYRTFQLATDGTTVYTAMGGPGGRLRAYRASDGSIAWEDTADGDVQACALANGLVIIGGHFDTLDHIARARIGAADAGSGALDAWAPALNGSIWTLEATSTTIHLGGSFTRVHGFIQDGYARFSSS